MKSINKMKKKCPICKRMVPGHSLPFKSHLRVKHGIRTLEAQRPILEKIFPEEVALIKLKTLQRAKKLTINN